MLLQVHCVTRGLTLSASSSMPRVTGGLDQIHKVKSPLPEPPASKIPDFWDQRVEVPRVGAVDRFRLLPVGFLSCGTQLSFILRYKTLSETDPKSDEI